MKLEAVELRRIELPLVRPFRTSFGTQTSREVLLVRAVSADAEGWGECVAMSAPLYSSETVAGAEAVLEQHLLPRLFAAGELTPPRVARVLEPVVGHRMAKGAVELAVLDAYLRARGEPLAAYLGAVHDRVPCGVSVGIADDLQQLLEWVGGYLDEGYRRIKLKIEPGWDVAAVAAVRERFGDDLPLQVDANAAYRLGDARHLAQLDAFDLLLIEQPFPEEQVRAHAELARTVRTPVCLDESITSAQVLADAIALGAVHVVNVKAGRVGGYLEGRRVHDVAPAHGLPTWCGGMVETGIGRAANVALAALPNMLLPGDVSASDRFFATDIVRVPLRMQDGTMAVPEGPGLGVEVDAAVLDEVTTSARTLRPGA